MDTALATQPAKTTYAKVERSTISHMELNERIECALAIFNHTKLPHDSFTTSLNRIAGHFSVASNPRAGNGLGALKWAKNELSHLFGQTADKAEEQQHIYNHFISVLEGTPYAIK